MRYLLNVTDIQTVGRIAIPTSRGLLNCVINNECDSDWLMPLQYWRASAMVSIHQDLHRHDAGGTMPSRWNILLLAHDVLFNEPNKLPGI